MRYIIEAKDESVFDNLFEVAWHPILVDLYKWIMATLLSDPIITSAYRPGDKGVHGSVPLRAFDLRTHGFDGKLLSETISSYWQYDYMRPKLQCALYHDTGKGLHLHCQVHPRTQIENGGWSVTFK